jgi:hypothetical protein
MAQPVQSEQQSSDCECRQTVVPPKLQNLGYAFSRDNVHKRNPSPRLDAECHELNVKVALYQMVDYFPDY